MDPFLLSSPASPFTKVGEPTTNAMGQPVQLVTKELIRVGQYRHPTQKWNLAVTPERLHKIAAASNRAIENGVRCPLPDGHQDLSAKNNRGWVRKFEVRGSSLHGEVELVGADAIAAAGRNDVSIFLEPEFVDGRGTNYGECVTHVALTPAPVVPGLDGFIPIAASRPSLTRACPFAYDSASPTLPDRIGDDPMPLDLAKLRKLIGADDTLTEANLHDRLAAHLAGLADASKAMSTELTSAKAKITTLEQATPPTVDPEALEDRADALGEKVDALVTGGKITAAVAAALKPALLGAKSARPVFMLSRKVSGTEQTVARAIVDALALNNPVELAEKTGAQGVGLSRTTPDAATQTKRTESILGDMAAAAGVPAKK